MTAVADQSSPSPETAQREHLSNLRGLLLLSMLMTASEEGDQIARLAMSSVRSFGPARPRGIHVAGVGWVALEDPCTDPPLQAELARQLRSLNSVGGQVEIPGDAWAWAFSLGGRPRGFLVAGAAIEPSSDARSFIQVLAQQTGAALASARRHASARSATAQLSTLNESLEATLAALQRSMDIHNRLTQVAVRDEGQEGLALAIHELTAFPVAIEDRYGNLRAWAGPGKPEPYPKPAAPEREELMRRLIRNGRPMRDGGRLVALARPRGDLLGVLALIDPADTAGAHELVALEHGATILAMELARLRSLAEAELRLKRDLVDALLDGTDDEIVESRAQGLGYDLGRAHRVVVAESRATTRDDDAFFHAVRRAARDLSVGTLLAARKGTVVVIASRDVPWEEFHQAIVREPGGGRCRLGVGSHCIRPRDFAQSHREAHLALRMEHSAGVDQVSNFDDLGVYRLLSGIQDLGDVERFVGDRLGVLLEHDRQRNSELVRTLTQYLECGGSYDRAAAALFVHRSTLKYRLQQIRDITGYNLSDPDTRFTLQLSTRAWSTLRALRTSDEAAALESSGRSQ
jgi:DNA-binding PucR family transcriptional regulator